MTIKNDKWILQQCEENEIIKPYEKEQIKIKERNWDIIQMSNGCVGSTVLESSEEKLISYGPSSYGYDIRCTNKFKLFRPAYNAIIDPKNFDSRNFEEIETSCLIIPGNSFALTGSVEHFKIPRDVLGICLGKSTYARCGVVVNITPLEPEWEGYLTIEISNTAPNPVKIYANEGIAQLLFIYGVDCKTSYRDKNGKYQNQSGITVSKV